MAELEAIEKMSPKPHNAWQLDVVNGCNETTGKNDSIRRIN